MPDYTQSKIYKITSANSDGVYIGSTTLELDRRLRHHEQQTQIGRNKCTSRDIITLGDFRIELLEEFPCDTREELNIREGYWMKQFPNRVNRCLAGRTSMEYHFDNRERLLERMKIRSKKDYQANKAKVLERSKIKWNETGSKKVICGCGLTIAYKSSRSSRHIKSKRHQNYLTSEQE